jgi:futalosine hydrolase
MNQKQKIAVVAATEKEIEPFIHFISQTVFPSFEIQILITGVGIANAVYFLTKYLQQSKPNLAIQAGIAGAANQSLTIGETVHVVSDQFSLYGAWNQNYFTDIFTMGFENPNEVPYTNGKLQGNSNNHFSHLPKVHGITSNSVSGNLDQIEKLKLMYQFDVETMEGAAFQFVMNLENIPSSQIRAISNYLKPRDESQWNIQLAIENLNNELISFFKKLV